MHDHRHRLADALEALHVRPDGSYSWFGERFRAPVDPVEAVALRLYADFYTQGAASPAVDRRTRPARVGRRDLARVVEDAVGGRDCVEPGWTVVHATPTVVRVERDGIVIRAPRDAVITAPGVAAPGDVVSLRVSRHRPSASRGHLCILGRGGGPGTGARSRLYWNNMPSGAPALAAALTRRLDAACVPFLLKVVADASDYDRCDTAVLLVPRTNADGVIELSRTVADSLRTSMRRQTPVFTLPIGGGLAYADDPPAGESFGMTRCRLVAAGVMRAARTRADPLTEVEKAFAAAGVSLDAAHRRADDPPVHAESAPYRPHIAASPREQDPLEGAMAIGRRLVSSAVRHAGRCTWMTADFEAPRGRRVRLRPCDGTLYDGTAGIALVLAELSAASGDGLFAAEARAAIRHALDAADALGAGLHGGLGGVAHAAIRVGGLLDDEEAIAAGFGMLDGLPGGDGRTDLMGGTAGSLAARLLHPEPCGADAHALADEVLRAARHRGPLRSWSADPSDGDDLTGMAHGTAGIGLVLAEAGRALKRRDLADAALGAFAYERAQRRQHGAWLDLRGRNRMGAPGPSERVAWCHGAAGIALSRVRAWHLLDDDALAADAIDALDATKARVQAALVSMGTDFGLCHGLAGLAEVLLEGARALPHRAGEWESAARAVVSEGLVRHHRTEVPWPCGPAGELPGLMTGIAGIAHFLLRAVDPSMPSVLHIGPSTTRAPTRAPQPTQEVLHVA